MWKYSNMDEIYHSYINNSDELFHSDVYLGEDYSDGLKHWKYIKKYNKNGRTYYVYENNLETQRDILKSNIKWEKDMIKNNKTYTNPQTGQKFGSDHYKKAVKHDIKDLNDVNKKISKQSKIEKQASKTAVKIANGVLDTKYKAKKKVSKALKKLSKKK